MSKFQVQKRNGGVVHAGYEFNEYVMSDCGAGRSHNRAGATEARTWVKVSAPVTCKRCLKKIEKAEYLGLHLKVVDNEDGSSKVVDTREDVAPRRARNRSNYKRTEKTGIESLRDMLTLY